MTTSGSRRALRRGIAACAGLALWLLGSPVELRAEDDSAPPADAPSAAPADAPSAAPADAPTDPAMDPPAAPLRESQASPLLREASEVRRRANERGIETQKKIDALSDKTDEYYAGYTAALSQLASLRSYNERMRELVASQESELGSLHTQLDQVDAVGRSVTPLMMRMIAALEEFVALDLPFLLEERRDRIDQLRRLLHRADVSVSEKYRRIMEAYQIESEYGRTIEAYQAPLAPGGDGESVDYLRFGRIALMYLTLDGREGGAWDRESRSWQPLGGGAIDDVSQGLRVARKLIPPDLIRLPLPEPQDAGDAS